MAKGIIRELRSQWHSPLVVVTKPDGFLGLCVDFRKVNATARFDAFPMLWVEEMLEKVGQAKYISTLDLTKDYWQIPMAPEDCEKTAFRTPWGLFEFLIMPCELNGAVVTCHGLDLCCTSVKSDGLY